MIPRVDSVVCTSERNRIPPGRAWLLACRLGLAAAALTAVPASAQVITSPDGRWSATLDPNQTGQIIGMTGPGISGNHVFETLWYEATSMTGMAARRVENLYSTQGVRVEPHSAFYDLRPPSQTMALGVQINMENGAAGGARVELTWFKLFAPPERITVKPIVYVDLDVEGDNEDDCAAWDAANEVIVQNDGGCPPAPLAPTLWIGELGPYDAWELDTWPLLRDNLDGGRSDLNSTGGGFTEDWTAALSVAEAELVGPGTMHSMTFRIGGPNVSCCVGDADGDCDTDLGDLGVVLADFGCTGGNCPGDLNGDGTTDLTDLGILLADFGCVP